MASLPIAEGLFTWPAANPCLIGGQCNQCECVEFPYQSSCPKCGCDQVEAIHLHRRGALWSWTIQGFPPKSPPFKGDIENFTPFGVGYIELPNQVCVEAPLTVNDPSLLRIGMLMELVIQTHHQDDHGNAIVGFAFTPVEDN